MRIVPSLIALLAAGALVACGPGAEEKEADGEGAAHWSYAEQEEWGGECPNGSEQSPISLASTTAQTDLPDLRPSFAEGSGQFINNGHTLQFTPSAPGATTIGADSYDLVQFHFHGASEHKLDGVNYPLELHFVHKNAAGQLAVVGVFIGDGDSNPALAALIAALPNEAGEEHATSPSVDPAALLPASMRYFAYAGSLTTPPCSEGVRWNVLATPIFASHDQIQALTAALGSSNREVQPLNTRVLSFGE
jgi:carbonic anhydrase